MAGSKLDNSITAIIQVHVLFLNSQNLFVLDFNIFLNQVIESLSDQDRLHLIAYDTDVQTIFENVVPDALHKPFLIEQVEKSLLLRCFLFIY